MTETVTIPARIEIGELRLDGPIRNNVAIADVRVSGQSAPGRLPATQVDQLAHPAADGVSVRGAGRAGAKGMESAGAQRA